jgi:hypothetical protein
MEIKVMLKQMVGQIASVNSSPTLCAKLVSVGNKCVWEVAPSRYGDRNNNRVGECFELPLWISENCFWGV